jgi:hypothetical protein
LSILLNFWFFNKNNNINKELEFNTTEKERSNSMLNTFIDSQISQFNYNGKHFNADQNILDSLKKFINNKPKLFLSFNESSCETCVDLAIDKLKLIAPKLGYENIILLTQYKNKREPFYLSKKLGDKFKIFNIPDEKYIILDKNYSSQPPNFFILDKNMIINYFFYHSINFPSLNNAFFQSIVNYFENVNRQPNVYR